MAASLARVAMAQPRRYLGQLCRHFAHRLPVTLAETSGSIAFPAGTCGLVAEDGALALRIEAADPAALPGLEDVAARHLLRFAFREPPEIRWVREAG